MLTMQHILHAHEEKIGLRIGNDLRIRCSRCDIIIGKNVACAVHASEYGRNTSRQFLQDQRLKTGGRGRDNHDHPVDSAGKQVADYAVRKYDRGEDFPLSDCLHGILLGVIHDKINFRPGRIQLEQCGKRRAECAGVIDPGDSDGNGCILIPL